MSYPWLPNEIDYNAFGGRLEPFIEEVYRIFQKDFVLGQAKVLGVRLAVSKELDDGKEKTFWHLVTRNYSGSGKREEDREPDIARAKKLPWARVILDAADARSQAEDIHVWIVPADPDEGRREDRIKIALANFSYLIVIARKSHGGVVMVTAFPTEGHYPKTVRKEFERFKKGARYGS